MLEWKDALGKQGMGDWQGHVGRSQGGDNENKVF